MKFHEIAVFSVLYLFSNSSDLNIGSSKNSITLILNPHAIIITVFNSTPFLFFVPRIDYSFNLKRAVSAVLIPVF